MRHYLGERWDELRKKWVTVGTRDAESPEDARKKLAYNSRLDPHTIQRITDLGPAKGGRE